jgi:NADPH:quinone reductase-like Zn-dependent oxidoreductase
VAKALGARVTAVCSGRNAALAVELGADHVVDYAAAALSAEAPANSAQGAVGGLVAALLAAVDAAGRPFDLCFDTVTSSEVRRGTLLATRPTPQPCPAGCHI